MCLLENFLYLIPIAIGVVCFISTYAVIAVLLLPRKGLFIQKLPSFFRYLNKAKPLQIQNIRLELDPVLEEKITALLKTVTDQIPMGSMLLSSSLGKTLKEKTKLAILEMLPELKDKSLIKVEKLLEEGWEEQGWRLLLKYGTLAALFSAFVGSFLSGCCVWGYHSL